MSKKFRIATGNDHRGFFVKEKVRAYLIGSGHDVLDVGAYDCNSSDFPDYAEKIVTEIKNGYERGILICGSGSGMLMVANRFRGIRAAPCFDVESAKQGREHLNINIAVLRASDLGEGVEEILDTFLNTGFSGKEKYIRRIKKLDSF